MVRTEFWVWAVLAVGLAGVRLMGDRSQAFQAVAHLCVGALIASAWYRWSGARWWQVRRWPYQAALALVLSLIELAAFFLLPR